MTNWVQETTIVQVQPSDPNMSYADAAPPGFTGGHGYTNFSGNYQYHRTDWVQAPKDNEFQIEAPRNFHQQMNQRQQQTFQPQMNQRQRQTFQPTKPSRPVDLNETWNCCKLIMMLLWWQFYLPIYFNVLCWLFMIVLWIGLVQLLAYVCSGCGKYCCSTMTYQTSVFKKGLECTKVVAKRGWQLCACQWQAQWAA